MKTKLLTLVVVLAATTGLWASNVITYTATSQLSETTDTYSIGLHTNAFNVAISSHTFSNGTGTITFAGEVTTIGEYTFCQCNSLTSVTIPNSVTTIGSSAFGNCSGLTKTNYTGSIADWCKIKFGNPYANPMYYSHNFYINDVEVKDLVIPDGVDTIGDYAFFGCSSLTSVTIPNSVTAIGDDAFYGCSSLTKTNYTGSIADWCKMKFGNSYDNPMYYSHNFYINDVEVKDLVIPDGVDTIGNSAFRDCSGLTSVTIPNSVTTIGNSAFQDCSGLTSVTIPNSVTTIGEFAFYNVNNIIYNGAAIGFPWGAKCANGFVDGYLIYSDATKTKICGCPSFVFGAMTIPNTVITIGRQAFAYCDGITSVTIPNSVTAIGDDAFYGCSNLTKTNFTGTIANWCKIKFGNSYANPMYYSHNFYINDVEVKDLVIPQEVDTIGEYAFYQCSGLTSVTIPNSVSTIGDHAFYSCSGLTSPVYNANCFAYMPKSYQGAYTIPNSITQIAGGAFSGCSGLTSITIPNSVTTIGDYAFDGCSGLTSITIPNSVTTIGRGAFSGCSGLTKTNYTGSIADWCKIQFGGFYSNPIYYSHNFYINDVEVTDLVIPEGVDTIRSFTFCNCNSLTSVTIPNSVTTIEYYAFQNCFYLKTVYNNSALPIIEGSRDYGFVADRADGIIKDNMLIKQGTSLAKYVGTEQSVSIPDYITGIGNEAFKECNLVSITIPHSVTTIGDSAFNGCNGIKSVTWNAKNCNGYNFGSQVETFIFGDSVEIIPANVCQDMTHMTTITIPSSVQSVGNSAFKNCTGISELNINDGLTAIGDYAFYGLSNKNLKEIALPNSVETIGKYAFAECSYLKTITLGAKLEDIDEYAFQNDERLIYVNCYAEEPPVLQENAFDNYDIYLQVPCDVLDEYKVAKGWKLFNRENVSCLSAEGKTVTGDDVIVTPFATTATFIWPSNDKADSYSLEITKDGAVFCTLKFNANGQLMGISFAAGRGHTAMAHAATSTNAGWQFTVTGLNQASKYAYTMDVKNASQKSIKIYTGEFVTDGYTDLLPLLYEGKEGIGASKFIHNGRLLIERNGILYDAHGARVE